MVCGCFSGFWLGICTPKHMEDISGEEKPIHNNWLDQKHAPGGRHICQNQQ